MQQVCRNCGSPQGPFTKDKMFPNTPVCGYPKRYRFDTVKERFDASQKRVRECLARREMRYSE